jgi:hypothetical protein
MNVLDHLCAMRKAQLMPSPSADTKFVLSLLKFLRYTKNVLSIFK